MAKFDAALAKRNREALQDASPLFDQINEAWDKIERFFRKQGILRAVSYPYQSLYEWNGNEEVEIGNHLLGIQKHKGKWRVCYGVEYDRAPPPFEVSWTPVTACGASLRIELFDHVAGLFERLVKSNEDYIPEMEQALEKWHEVLSDLEVGAED